jgi:hypothetical protein
VEGGGGGWHWRLFVVVTLFGLVANGDMRSQRISCERWRWSMAVARFCWSRFVGVIGAW